MRRTGWLTCARSLTTSKAISSRTDLACGSDATSKFWCRELNQVGGQRGLTAMGCGGDTRGFAGPLRDLTLVLTGSELQ